MQSLMRLWEHLEEAFIAFLLAAMTLVTFVYVMLNNVYTLFYALSDKWAFSRDFFASAGDHMMGYAQDMTWSVALTKAMFGWLIFFGMSYGVRTAGHLGLDALVKLTPHRVQRWLAMIACLCCLAYAGLFVVASFKWLNALFIASIGAEDLDQFGVTLSDIAVIVPIGFAMVVIRYLEIFWRLYTHRQIGLGLADEAAEASKLASPDSEQH
ncbi:TRAP transporter small permease [Pseudomonas sp. CCC3.2]|uniref:TRAP transporter small permease n=1 Tax=unclassified Pseudomonas TaxID=196821 RepID=UPI002AB4DE03|nr:MULTISPECIES: TRAP transporter small permease [unclassified Pseudomonas]MDY7560977.1 TRAP transporter small permease [Pseudomonas sp. AB6]MEB0180405.1 TRAP transporter small permease [Pseudomonas sp. CCC3.2]MEB0210143.1 TRAP transporter small permease [Pseudomonas sp. AB6]